MNKSHGSMSDVRKELAALSQAWKEYLGECLFRLIHDRRVASITIVSLAAFFGGLVWVLRTFVNPEPVYGQVGAVIESGGIWPVLSKVFYWVVGGGLLGAITRLTRKNYLFLKRTADIVVSVVGLIILSPLFAILAILIKIDSAGNVLFKQERVGKDGKIFQMWKFRTMRSNAELETGPVWAQEDDPRITKLGQFLRKSHLDELPQFINILKGEMSLIGPRPERPELVDEIKREVPDFDRRLKIKPGIAGLAQSRYQYGASAKDASRKLKYDMIYIKKVCLLLDMRILFWTTGRVLTGEGAR